MQRVSAISDTDEGIRIGVPCALKGSDVIISGIHYVVQKTPSIYYTIADAPGEERVVKFKGNPLKCVKPISQKVSKEALTAWMNKDKEQIVAHHTPRELP